MFLLMIWQSISTYAITIMTLYIETYEMFQHQNKKSLNIYGLNI